MYRLKPSVITNIGVDYSGGGVFSTFEDQTMQDLDGKIIGGDSVILFMPTTSDASTVTIHVTGRQKGQATLNHASATTTRSFDYVIFG